MENKTSNLLPVIVLGGQENALSITRSLGKMGVSVTVVAAADCAALDSRYCSARFPIPAGIRAPVYWEEMLLGDKKSPLQGSILFTCSDDAIQFVANRHEELSRYYTLDKHLPDLQLDLLDKQKTLEMARDAGIPIPSFWKVESAEDIECVREEFQYPLILKPILSHVFQTHFGGRKFLKVDSDEELGKAASSLLDLKLPFMVCELIPGPDTMLSSYYTYQDEEGASLFEFTKAVIRRYPVNHGGATHHVTRWDEETAELGRRFFRHIGFRALGNIEFKRDSRDGKLKVIECNARFTAAQELLVRSGMDTARIVYRHLCGEAGDAPSAYRDDLHMLYFFRDARAFLQLRSMGALSLFGWLASIMRPQVFPYLSVGDPGPAIKRSLRYFRYKLLGAKA